MTMFYFATNKTKNVDNSLFPQISEPESTSLSIDELPVQRADATVLHREREVVDRFPQEPVDNGLPVGGAAVHAHPMSRLDGCPECVLNTELPKSTAPTDNGYRAAYLCNDCGHAWTTDWTD